MARLPGRVRGGGRNHVVMELVTVMGHNARQLRSGSAQYVAVESFSMPARRSRRFTEMAERMIHGVVGGRALCLKKS